MMPSANNTMTIQIVILAMVFLEERLDPTPIVGLIRAAIGAAIVQLAPVLRRSVRPSRRAP
jgi:hypothetical protein